jgi:hypothetical protein
VSTLDDEFLDTLLRQVGDSFTVPSSGPSAILGRVHRDDDERAGLGRPGTDAGDPAAPAPAAARTVRRTIHRTVSDHRMLAVAASVLVLLLVAGGAVWLGHGTPKTTAALKAVRATPSPHTGYRVAHKPAGSTKAAGATPSVPSVGSSAATPAPSTAGTASNASNTPDAAGSQFGALGLPARIEQTGSLDLSVGRGALSATVNRLTALAGANGGFVANSETHSGSEGGAPSATVTLQVPVASFSAVLRQAQSFGKASQLTTSATDVTGQYVDLQSRITALEASRQQYLTIMTKASSIGDVLAVQAQLDSLQSQIEQLQGQLAVLGSETDYSRMTTVVSEPGEPHHHPAVVNHSGLARAWHDSVHGFVAGAEGLIRIAGPALFALLCLGAVLLGGQIFWRRLQRHNL